jgi:hypothetical protein
MVGVSERGVGAAAAVESDTSIRYSERSLASPAVCSSHIGFSIARVPGFENSQEAFAYG